MSMCCSLFMASDGCIDYLAEHPEVILSFVCPEAMAGEDVSPAELAARGCGRTDGDEYSTYSWHGLHYLFTETEWEDVGPLSFFVAEGVCLEDDVGSLTAFQAEAVADLFEAMSMLDRDALRDRFEPEKMNALDIYPFCWDDEGRLEELLSEFDSFYGFVERTRDAGKGLVRMIG